MAEPNPDPWAQSHTRWLALSRWDNEGGASPWRHTEGSVEQTVSPAIRSDLGARLLLLALQASLSLSSTRALLQASGH
jgi:hypothetical protein